MTGSDLLALLKKNPVGVGCGALALLLGGAGYYRSGGLPTAETELEQKSTEAQRFAANLKNSAQLPEQLATLTAADKEIAARLVRAGQLVDNTQYFYRLVADTGVRLADFHQNPPSSSTKNAAKGAHIPVGFGLTVQGEYVQLLTFLRQLEGGAHYCRLLTANLTAPAASETGRSTALTLTLTFDLFGQP